MSSDESGTPASFADLKIRVSDAVPAGEMWLTSGCARKATRPEIPHGEPEWRVAGICVHEHLERHLLCAGCKEELERWQRTRLEPPGPWCAPCYWLRPGGHRCMMAVEFKPLGSGVDFFPDGDLDEGVVP